MHNSTNHKTCSHKTQMSLAPLVKIYIESGLVSVRHFLWPKACCWLQLGIFISSPETWCVELSISSNRNANKSVILTVQQCFAGLNKTIIPKSLQHQHPLQQPSPMGVLCAEMGPRAPRARLWKQSAFCGDKKQDNKQRYFKSCHFTFPRCDSLITYYFRNVFSKII